MAAPARLYVPPIPFPTYSAAGQETNGIGANAGDLSAMFGVANYILYVVKVRFLLVQGTAQYFDMSLLKHTAANSAGTTANITSIPHDSTFPNAQGVPYVVSVKQTEGASTAVRREPVLASNAVATPAEHIEWTFYESPIVLRGTTQGVALHSNSAVAVTFYVTWEWFESTV